MSFYARFAEHYERVFPLREKTLAFLRAHLPVRGRVLDAGCGPGHHCGALATAGLEMVGIDLDPAMIAAAEARYPQAAFQVRDLRDVARMGGRLDGAYCIGNVLPHLPLDVLDAFLLDLASLLTPGAPWIVQTVNFDRLLPLTQAFDFPDLEVGEGLVFKRRYEPATGGAIRFRTELDQSGQRLFAGDETLHPVRAADLAARCAATGLSVEAIHGDFTGAPYDPRAAAALVLVARRDPTRTRP